MALSQLLTCALLPAGAYFLVTGCTGLKESKEHSTNSKIKILMGGSFLTLYALNTHPSNFTLKKTTFITNEIGWEDRMYMAASSFIGTVAAIVYLRVFAFSSP